MKQACSRTIQTSGANRFVRGAHHRRCAREGLTGAYNAQFEPQVQARDDYMSLTGYILRRQYIFDMVHTYWTYQTLFALMIIPHLDKLLARENRSFYWLAKETGISHTTLWRLKKGKAVGINFETLEKLCRALRCSPGDVLFLTSQKNSPRRRSLVGLRKR